MNTVDIITKKRDGKILTPAEIEYMVQGYTNGSIPDYQMAAFLMAVYFIGMNEEETIALTGYMRDSGDVVDLSEIKGTKVDKHSTGGVGDKTTLIVGPLAAACGVPVAKMSGRGLGFTGGTVDKMEAIPGFRTSMEREEFIRQVNEIGIAVIGQTGHIAPADKKMYALRDVTGTVENLGLITASIMSKKLAAGTDAIVLDVKTGRGAFMKSEEDSVALAEMMVKIGKGSGKKTVAVISDMEEPLGLAVGNALEVREAMDVLKGQGPADVKSLSIKLAGLMIHLSSGEEIEAAAKRAESALSEGSALEKFREFVAAQGGNSDITEDYSLLPQAGKEEEVRAKASGYIQRVDAMTIGMASQHTGAGREKKNDSVDLSAGIILAAKTGDRVSSGDLLCTLYGNNENKIQAAAKEAEKAFEIGRDIPTGRELIKRIVE